MDTSLIPDKGRAKGPLRWPLYLFRFAYGAVIATAVLMILPAIDLNLVPRKVDPTIVDISSLGTALTDFKATFGSYPPSNITLYPNAAGWNSDSRSADVIRQLWPSFDFSGSGGLGITKRVTLDGSECLVFFGSSGWSGRLSDELISGFV